MKYFGIVTGGALQAVPLVVGKDTVYVHTDITRLPDDEECAGLWQYHEVQYSKDEYIKLMAEKNIELKSVVDAILGVDENG
jgi:hypothetical protein